MKYTAKQFAEETINRVDFNSGVVNLNTVELNEGYSILINKDVVVISEDSGVKGEVWVRTDIIRVRDILQISISDENTVTVTTSLGNFYISTNSCSQNLALALIEVL